MNHNTKFKQSSRGCSLTGWLALVGWLALSAGWFIFLDPRNNDNTIVLSLFCGLLSLGTLWAIRRLFDYENEQALNRALRGLPLKDGQWGAAVGEILPLNNETIIAPFSGQKVLAYKYWINRFEKLVSGKTLRISKNHHLLTAYTGFAIVPCEVRAIGGDVRILGMPVLDGTMQSISGDDAYDRARSYIANTVFEDGFAGGKESIEDSPFLKEPFGTTSPVLKKDVRENPGPNLFGWSLNEIIVPAGERVCVYGTYSAALNALTAPDKVTGSRLFTLVIGDAQQVRTTLRTQRLALYFFLSLLLIIQGLITWRMLV